VRGASCAHVRKMRMQSWQKALAESITTADELIDAFPSQSWNTSEIRDVIQQFPMRISPYFLGVMKRFGAPLWAQAVPTGEELDDQTGMEDPLAEERFSPVTNITHRYPDRVLFLVSNQCAVYCRFCTRKRKTGKGFPVNRKTIENAISYIRDNRNIRDVLVSGGDPLLLEDDVLAEILNDLRSIRHVEIIRIGTRVPCTLPQRITRKLGNTLKKFHPVYVNTHFNHPDEITPEAARACTLLSDAGIPLGCQTVLLKGINDSPPIMKALMQKLLSIRVRPYYIHHVDLARGTGHFRTSLPAGIRIIEALHGSTTGMCVPRYVVDLPGGGGKVPLGPESVAGMEKQAILLKNYQGKIFRYRLSEEEAAALSANRFQSVGM